MTYIHYTDIIVAEQFDFENTLRTQRDKNGFQWKCFVLVILTLIGSLFKAVIYLLKHGLTATLKHGENNALEGVFVGCLYRPLHGFGCGSPNGIGSVLQKKKKFKKGMKL